MFRYLIIIILMVHGLIHLMGFVKSVHPESIRQLIQPIGKGTGIVWLSVAVIMTISAVLLMMEKNMWWIPALIALSISQVLILSNWQDAKAGTVANILLLAGVVAGFGNWRFETSYRKDVQNVMNLSKDTYGIIIQEDLAHLPEPVKRYLMYVGVVGKPRVHNFRAVFKGKMREKGKDWFVFRSEQYNTLNTYTRQFFMKGKMYGMQVPGYHHYNNGTATMDIKLIGLIPVVAISGEEMNKAETVTVFNDLCLMAPAALIDKRIQWRAIDSLNAEAAFTCNDITIRATLHFNKEGQLVNFTSEDRYVVSDMMQYLFSTPVKDYKDFDGYKLASYGAAIWHLPEGEFEYGQFNLEDLQYNVTQ